MKQGFDEGYFIKNDQKSAIQCIEFQHQKAGVYADYHYHNYIEMLYGIDCDIQIWVDDIKETFQSGDVCLIPSMKTHYIYSKNKSNSYMVLKFSPEILTYRGQTLSELQALLPYVKKCCHGNIIIKRDSFFDNDIGTSINNIVNEWKHEEYGYELAIRGELLTILAKLLRIRENSEENNFHIINDGVTNTLLNAAYYAAENCSIISAQEAAQYAHMSYSYFSRMFKSVMGKTFSRFIIEVRIDEAKRILLTTDDSISDISQNLGFSTLSHFTYTFRKATGYTPNNYRKLHRHYER